MVLGRRLGAVSVGGSVAASAEFGTNCEFVAAARVFGGEAERFRLM